MKQSPSPQKEQPSDLRSRRMKAYVVFSGGSPLLIMTSFDSIRAPKLLDLLAAKGIPKFIAFEVSIDSAKTRYGEHFEVECEDLRETDDLRVLDYNGDRVVKNFGFDEMGPPSFIDATLKSVPAS